MDEAEEGVHHEDEVVAVVAEGEAEEEAEASRKRGHM